VSPRRRAEARNTLEASRAYADPVHLARLRRGENLSLNGTNSWAEGTALCGNLPRDCDWHRVFRRDGHQTSVDFFLLRTVQDGPEPPTTSQMTEPWAPKEKPLLSQSKITTKLSRLPIDHWKLGVTLLTILTSFALGFALGQILHGRDCNLKFPQQLAVLQSMRTLSCSCFRRFAQQPTPTFFGSSLMPSF
jgi:hypothetical protein